MALPQPSTSRAPHRTPNRVQGRVQIRVQAGQVSMVALLGLAVMSLGTAFLITWLVISRPEAPAPATPITVADADAADTAPPPSNPTPANPEPPETDRQLARIETLIAKQNEQLNKLIALLEKQTAPAGAPPTTTKPTPDESIESIALQTALQDVVAELKKINQSSSAHPPIDTDTKTILRAIDELPFERYEQHLTQVLLKLSQQSPAPTQEALAQLVQEAVNQALQEQQATDPFANRNLLTAAEDNLTPLQAAFQDAFRTGQPITVGQAIDPITGEALPGRTLDPQAAFRAGHRTWQAWYEADRQEEVNRLQAPANEPANPALIWD